MNEEKIIGIIGNIGLDKALTLYSENENLVKKYFSKKFVDDIDNMKIEYETRTDEEERMLAVLESKTCYIKEIDTGLHRALWNMKESLKCGFEVDAKKIPISQEVVEILEYFKEDFFDSESKGSSLFVIEQDKKIELEKELDFGVAYKTIGYTTKGHAGNIHIDDRVRHIDRPTKYRKDN